jgi:hypothetical protein
MAIDPILANEAEARKWATALRMPPGWATYLIPHFKDTWAKLERMTPDEVAAWRQHEIHTSTRDGKVQEARGKIDSFLRAGSDTPFGAALEGSELRHCSMLKRTIADYANTI